MNLQERVKVKGFSLPLLNQALSCCGSRRMACPFPVSLQIQSQPQILLADR